MTTEQERYSLALQDLYQRTTQGIKLGLDNTQQLLDALGNPERKMKHVVVAGTNGKGSTSSLLATVCQEAGHRTGLYTSPHLLRFTERIKIDGIELSQDRVLEYYETIRSVEAACDALPTFFEVTTAMALMAFADAGVQIAVMEVGLGGRLDSTNVVDKTLSIITPIAMDHVHILGNTLAEIASEKAGIITATAPALSAKQKPEAQAVLEETCQGLNTTLHSCSEYSRTAETLTIQADKATKSFSYKGPDYQACNINTVAHALPLLTKAGFDMGLRHLEQALAHWQWPGRFQSLNHDCQVILDGAHNPHALQALMDTLKDRNNQPLHIVFSAIHTKDAGNMIDTLVENTPFVYLCPSSVGKSLSEESLKSLNSRIPTYPGPAAAFNAASEAACRDGGLVLVTGSLFLVADILHHVTGERRDPGVVS